MQKHSKILTGFSFFDQKWGGVYPGGSYFIFGSKKSGKTILSLNIIENLVQSDYSVLLLTSQRQKSLEIQSSSIYFNLDEAISSGFLKVHRIDENLSNLESIKTIIEQSNPTFIFIDELTDKNFQNAQENFLELLEYLEDSNITSFFVSSTPSDESGKSFIKTIAKNSTAIIHLQKSSNKRNYSGTVTLKPNIGYFEGEFETSYKVEPIKGFITLSDNEQSIMEMFSKIEGPGQKENSKLFEYSNIYSLEEFKFLLESKIALSNKTGKKINIICYEMKKNDIKPVELCNRFLEILSKSDKICFTDDMIYILPEDSQNISVQKLTSQLDSVASDMLDNPDNIDSYLNKTIQLLNENFKIVEQK